MAQQSDRSRSPKRVGAEPEAWQGLRASLDDVNKAVYAILATGQAGADHLSNTQLVQLMQRLDGIAEDGLQLAKASNPAQPRVTNLNRTNSQALGQKRIEYVRSQIHERQEHMANLARSVSLLMKNPIPADVGQLREALTHVKQGQKEARKNGEDLFQFMMDLDNVSGLLDEDRNFRKNTIVCIDSLLASIDEAKDRLVILHARLDEELEKRQEQERLEEPRMRAQDEMIFESPKLGMMNLDRRKTQATGQKRIEYVRSQINERQEHMANLVTSVSLLLKNPVPDDIGQLREAITQVKQGQKEARKYGEDLWQFMMDLDNISVHLDEDRDFRKNAIVSIDSLLASIDEAKDRLVILHARLDKELEKRQEQERLEKAKEGDQQEMLSVPPKLGMVNVDRTKAQASCKKRIEYVRSQINERQNHMANLRRSVSLLIKDPVPDDVGELRDALKHVEREQKDARKYGEDLLQFMMDLDNMSGLLDEDRNLRKSTFACIDVLLAKIDEAKDRLVSLHELLDKELEKQQDQEKRVAEEVVKRTQEEREKRYAEEVVQRAQGERKKRDAEELVRRTQEERETRAMEEVERDKVPTEEVVTHMEAVQKIAISSEPLPVPSGLPVTFAPRGAQSYARMAS